MLQYLKSAMQWIILFVNVTKIYQFKGKDSERKPYSLCLGNMANDFVVNNLKKAGLNRCEYEFSVDYNTIDIITIHKFLMKKIYHNDIYLVVFNWIVFFNIFINIIHTNRIINKCFRIIIMR